MISSTAMAASITLLFIDSNRTRLLFWSSLGFFGLALNNVLLVVDLIFIPNTDLSLLRAVTALAGIGVLVGGLAWESR